MKISCLKLNKISVLFSWKFDQGNILCASEQVKQGTSLSLYPSPRDGKGQPRASATSAKERVVHHGRLSGTAVDTKGTLHVWTRHG